MLAATGMPAAELRDAVKTFGTVRALNGVSLAVQPGETVALLGPNGAGKTTAISLLLGLRAPTGGGAALFGRDPRDPASRRRIGAMLQESGVPATLKVREVVELFRRLYGQPLGVAAALGAANLADKANANVTTLSGGQRQRLYFALAIVGDPDLLFLDEPTVGLDVEARRAFWEQIGAMTGAGKTVLLTTHYLEEADALADRVVVIDRGAIVAEGSPAAIKARVGGKRIRFHTPDPALDEAALRQLPGVGRATRADGAVELYSTQPEATLARLFAGGATLTGLEVVGAGLEEAFVSLTRGAQTGDGTQEGARA
jgi:ABC-2 type transport system ATP-binding protein